MTPVELLEREERNCCYYFKYPVVYIRYNLSYYCSKIMNHSLFDPFIIVVIIANCVVLATDDPTTEIQEKWQEIADYVFQGIYSAELVLKVVAMGLIFNEGAYLRDLWNVFDLIIVAFGYFQYMNLGGGGFDLRPLRVFRVLRPLRTVTSIEGLRILMAALVGAIPMLLNAVIVLIFFFTIFAIAGLQMWYGILKKRCMETATGIFMEDEICGSRTCPDGYTCEDFGESPNYDVTKFDNFFSAMLVVFTAVTQEGWTTVQGYLIYAFGYASPVYFNILIYTGSYFFFNFTLAVINSKVSSLYDENRKRLANKPVTVGSKGLLKTRIQSKGTAFHNSAVKNIEMAGSVARIDMQTTVIGQYKDMMGIDEMEEDDLIIESHKPKKKKKEQAKETPGPAPKWLKKNFFDSLEPRPQTRRPNALVQDLDMFTNRFFHHTREGNRADQITTNRPNDLSILNSSESLLNSSLNYPDKQSDYSQVIENSFKTLSDNENRKENERENEEKQKSIEHIERQDTPGENQELLKDSPPESHASGEDQEDREEDKNTYQADKFVINEDINIDLTSERDVLAAEESREKKVTFSVVNVVAPDKLKVRYFPVVAAGAQGGKKEDKDGNTVKDTKSEKSRNISAKDSRSKGPDFGLSLIHICRCRRYAVCRSRWSP
eukprot:TRINITY_DN7255_c0_g1_i5.p1 TRINITY_DN7255_c0_g1~~TRINITY_DN7255_c0_g1_i5.p1  ORF type:complete len:661 (+),score=194.49 TRINITY_DN7255_c0_g1_i5:564-2546(+)